MAYKDIEQGRAKGRELYQKHKEEINAKRRQEREEERNYSTDNPRSILVGSTQIPWKKES